MYLKAWRAERASKRRRFSCNQKAFGETTWEMAAGARAWPDMNDVVMRDPKAKAGPGVLNNQQHMID
jgi:hypothetical protein